MVRSLLLLDRSRVLIKVACSCSRWYHGCGLDVRLMVTAAAEWSEGEEESSSDEEFNSDDEVPLAQRAKAKKPVANKPAPAKRPAKKSKVWRQITPYTASSL